MAFRESRVPAHLKANRDNLDNLISQFDGENGDENPVGVQGNRPPEDSDLEVLDPEAGKVSHVQTVDSFQKLGQEGDDPEIPGDDPALVDDEIPGAEDPSVRSLAKRTADARDAQRRMSKVQVKLDKTVETINGMVLEFTRRFSEAQGLFDRLAAVRMVTGDIPADLNPADQKTMESWRQDYAESLSVIDARVAPVYAALNRMSDQIQALSKELERSRHMTREAKADQEIFSKIPKATMQRVIALPQFLAWYQGQSPEYQAVIKSAVENTYEVDPRTVLKVFKDFSQETGINLGLAPQRTSQEDTPSDLEDDMPSLPTFRGGVRRSPAAPGGRRSRVEETPLSVKELSNLHNLMTVATPAEREVLNRRLALTNVSISGERAQDLKS